MELPDKETCYRALQSRDPRFDGLMYVGIKSTGIYCRTVCPARTAKYENCTFFPSAAAAHEAGYRPCLRCRPETAPELPSWRGTSNTVSRALALIADGALDGDGKTVDALAEHLGRPTAVRAVGLANGSNPIGVVVPCHRVIGSNGTLTDHGGGIERKRWLLEHENKDRTARLPL